MRTSTLKPHRSLVRPHVFIESAGIKHPTFTMHDFQSFKLEPDPEFGWLRPQWAVKYKCRETDVIRKFGLIDATSVSDAERLAEDEGPIQ